MDLKQQQKFRKLHKLIFLIYYLKLNLNTQIKGFYNSKLGVGWEARSSEFCKVSSVNARPAYNPSINSCTISLSNRCCGQLSPPALFSLLISLRQFLKFHPLQYLWSILSLGYSRFSDVGCSSQNSLEIQFSNPFWFDSLSVTSSFRCVVLIMIIEGRVYADFPQIVPSIWKCWLIKHVIWTCGIRGQSIPVKLASVILILMVNLNQG